MTEVSNLHLAVRNLPGLEITPVINKNPSVYYNQHNLSIAKSVDDRISRKIKDEKAIEKLLCNLPILNQHFLIHKKIGEGTYSTVYLASYRNSKCTKQFAIKHLTDNFSISRIQKEMRFMQMIGGFDNVVNILNYFKSNGKDCVVFIMPYLSHKRFSDYVLDMDANELRLYMKNLFIALRRVHSFNVIHRDVKPGNFLYNRCTKEFLLVDFGLAQEVNDSSKHKSAKIEMSVENVARPYSKRKRSITDVGVDVNKARILSPLKSRENLMAQVPSAAIMHRQSPHSFSTPSKHGTSPVLQPVLTSLLDKFPSHKSGTRTSFSSDSTSKNIALNLSVRSPSSYTNSRKDPSLVTSMLKSQTEIKLVSTPKYKNIGTDISKSFTPLIETASSPIDKMTVQIRNSQVVVKEPRCSCLGTSSVCSVCAGKRSLVAARAGTPGFRPPEVLLKHVDQTTAVDMWAAGVVLLCVLSGTYPFFKSPSDLAALMEIITIFGTDALKNVAQKIGRRLQCNITRLPLNLKNMCRRRRQRFANKRGKPAFKKCQDCSHSIMEDGCICNDGELSSSNVYTNGDKFPDSAYHLLSRLLDVDPFTRITAAEALQHPFITQVSLT